MYTVKNVKFFRGMEGTGFNCTLYRDGKKVALVDDEANGGEYHFHWFDRAEEKILDAHVKTLPPEPVENEMKKCFPKGMDITPDIFVSQLVSDFEMDSKWKRACKKGLCFRLKGDSKGYYMTLTCSPQFLDQAKDRMRQKYGDKIEEFINDRY